MPVTLEDASGFQGQADRVVTPANLEELVEILTWQQLGRHAKPVLLANIDGFWEPLLALFAHMRTMQFIRPNLQVDILKAERIEDILPRLRAAAARAPESSKEMAPEVARRL